jgi:multidrug efflux pump subunit AcrB
MTEQTPAGQESSHHGTLAWRLANTFTTSRLTMLVIVAVSFFGLFALVETPREENPQIVVPSAQVRVMMPGASSEEVEHLIVTPLEGIMSELPGVKNTYGVAMNSVGVVTVEFFAGEDKEDSLVKLYDRIQTNMDRLPAGASEPHIRSLDVDDMPIVTVTLASAIYDDYALKRLADRVGERLRSLPSVSVVSVRGGRDREVRIDLDPERLFTYGIPLSSVQQVLAASNLAMPAGNVVRDGQLETVFVAGRMRGVEDVRQLVIGQYEGRPVYLGDIADVVDGPPIERDKHGWFTFGAGDPRYVTHGPEQLASVTIGVGKKQGSNAVVIVDEVMDRIHDMEGSLIPHDVYVEITRNDGKKANDAVNLLVEHLGIAVFTVFLVLVVFLGWRAALIVTISVPLVFFVTIGVDLLVGVTINRVSLFAFILALGLLVDDAIVVIENVHRRYEIEGRKARNMAEKARLTVEACAEVGGAANLATAAVVVVFLSLFMIEDMMGQYFTPVGVNVPTAMIASLFIAYTVMPWAARRWLPVPETDAEGHSGEHTHEEGKVARLFRKIVSSSINRAGTRWMLYGGVIVLMLATAMMPAWQFMRSEGVAGPKSPLGVAVAFLPKDNTNTFTVAVETPHGTPLEETNALVRRINAFIVGQPQVVNTQSWVGQMGVVDFVGLLRGSGDRQGSHVAEIRVNLVDKSERATISVDLVRQLRPGIVEIARMIPGTDIQLLEDPPGPPMRATIYAEIYGKDLYMLRQLSDEVTEAFRNSYDMVDVRPEQPEDVLEHRIVVDKEKAALSGVSHLQVAQMLRLLFDEAVLGHIHPTGERHGVPVRVQVPQQYQLDPTRLDRVFVENAAGDAVPLATLVRLEQGVQDRPIFHKNNERVTFVGAELTQTAPFYAVVDLDQRLDGLDLSHLEGGQGLKLKTDNLGTERAVPQTINGYTLFWEGELRFTLDAFGDMGLATMLAMIAVFALLVGYYRSFSLPAVAMVSIPLGFIGIFPGHWITGQDFSATSMIGIIALAGVVIRSSLLMIDFARENVARGMDLEEAIIQAGIIRARPILLTTLAVILGTAVILMDTAFAGLAVALMSGAGVSSALTVLIVPVLYCRVERWRQRRDAKAAEKDALQAKAQ